MFKVKLWDKVSPVGNRSAENIKKEQPWVENVGNAGIILLLDNSDNVVCIENANILRGNLELDSSLSDLEVGEAYAKLLDQMEQEQKNKEDELEVLKAENADLQGRTAALEEAFMTLLAE